MTSDTYSSAGTFTWTCPAGGVSGGTVQVTCKGAGGSGGGAGAQVNSNGGGGGGGGHGYNAAVPVTPGQGYTVTVGAGGTAKQNSRGVDGGVSSFTGNSAVTVTGNGGKGGPVYLSGAAPGGAGGTGSGATVAYTGGPGASGSGTSSGYGGGGGSSAGSGAAGNSGSGSTGGAAPAGGAAGGNGGTSAHMAGYPGAAPGGGGGGSFSVDGTMQFSGAGADGQVVITYTAVTAVIAYAGAPAGAGAAPAPPQVGGGTYGIAGAWLDPALYGTDPAAAVAAWETKTARTLLARVTHYGGGVIPASAYTDDPAAAPPPVTVGVAKHGSYVGNFSTANAQSAITAWQNTVGRPLQERHYFDQSSIPSTVPAAAYGGEAGVRKMLVDFEPAHDGSQAAVFAGLMADAKARGLKLAVTIYHAPESKFSSPSAYISALAYYWRAVVDNGHDHIYDLTSWQADKKAILTNGWWPSGVKFTAIALEAYCIDYRAYGCRFDITANWADSHDLAFGLAEYGAAYGPAGGTDTEAQGNAFFNYAHDYMSTRIAASKKVWDCVSWCGGDSSGQVTPWYVVTSQPASWAAQYARMHDLLNKSSYGNAYGG